MQMFPNPMWYLGPCFGPEFLELKGLQLNSNVVMCRSCGLACEPRPDVLRSSACKVNDMVEEL